MITIKHQMKNKVKNGWNVRICEMEDGTFEIGFVSGCRQTSKNVMTWEDRSPRTILKTFWENS